MLCSSFLPHLNSSPPAHPSQPMGAAAPPGWRARLGWAGGWTPGFQGGGGLAPTGLLAGLSPTGWGCLGEGLKVDQKSQAASLCLGAGNLPLRPSQTRDRAWLPACQGLGPMRGLILSGVWKGMGWSSQLFFMSLTGNSIPTKFTPFGRIQEQDGVRRQKNQERREADRCWGRGLGPRVRPGSSLLCPNCPCGLGRVLLPSGPQFPYRATHHSELVEKMG